MSIGLQREEKPLDEGISRELVSLTPEWWRAVVLEVRYSCADGVDRYEHVISSPEAHRDPVVPSDELFDLTRRLRELFSRYGRPWTTVTYRVDVREDGTFSYVAQFEY